MRISFKNGGIDGEPICSELVNSYSDKDHASPRRSTVPLLAYWCPPQAGVEKLSKAIDQTLPDDLHLSFEHCVPVDSGRDSQTDLMLVTSDLAIAVEAKSTEPPYPSVRSWLGDPAPSNRQKVLSQWLELINRVTNSALTAADVAHCTYQLLHRTASVCSIPDLESRVVVYQLFHETDSATHRDKSSKYVEQLKCLREKLSIGSGLRLLLLTSRFASSERYRALLKRWHDGERQLSAEVRQGLIDGGLLRFQEDTMVEV